MSVIDRNITRTLYHASVPASAIETTHLTRTPSTDPLAFVLTSTGVLRLAFKGPFNIRHFNLSTVNSNATVVSIKIYDGTGFVDAEDVVDQTLGFTRSGFISWINIDNWKKAALSPIDDRELFWIELTVSADLSAGTELQSVLNLFADQDLLEVYYPEMTTDSRYLPPGKSSFIGQLKAGTDKVIKRLKQDKLIEDESQLLEDVVNQVSVAAAHGTASVVLGAIAKDEPDKEAAKEARDAMNDELNDVRLNIDFDKSGKISEAEKDRGDFFIARG